MDYEKLDKIVEDYIDLFPTYTYNYERILTCANEVLKQPDIVVKNSFWSRKISLNESINIAYNFFKSIDFTMAEQFYNIIRQTNNGKPSVEFIESKKLALRNKYVKNKDSISGSCVTRDGKVYIVYNNTPNDIFVIVHELLHKMNESYRMDYESKTDYLITDFINKISNKKIELGVLNESEVRDFYGESVSIAFETILGNYLVDNKIITKNDFDLRKRYRLESSKNNARDVIVETQLIKLKKSKEDINFQNLIKLLLNFDKNNLEYKVLQNEAHSLTRIKSIIKKEKMNIRISQRYVIGQYIANEFSKYNNFTINIVNLHKTISNPNADLKDVAAAIKKF